MSKNRIILALCLVLVVLQWRLWFGNGSILSLINLKKEVGHQRALVAQLDDRNQALRAEIQDLKERLDAIEERARTDLGMIKKNETFFFSTQERAK